MFIIIPGMAEGKELDDIGKLELADLSESKQEKFLNLIYYSGYNKFSKLVEFSTYSKGTASKYLNALEKKGLLQKVVSDDRSVDWELTRKGFLYILKKDWIQLDEIPEDREVHVLEERFQNIKEIVKERGLDKTVKSTDIQKLIEDIDYFKDLNLGEPEKSLIKTFTDNDLENYVYAVTRKDKED